MNNVVDTDEGLPCPSAPGATQPLTEVASWQSCLCCVTLLPGFGWPAKGGAPGPSGPGHILFLEFRNGTKRAKLESVCDKTYNL